MHARRSAVRLLGQLVVVICTVAITAAASHAQIPREEFAARRAALGALAGDGAIIVLGSAEPLNDYEGFSQSPHLRYLTGWDEPNGALLVIRSGGVQREMLFIAERNASQEVWTGPRPSLPDAERMSGIAARDISEFVRTCDSVLAEKIPMRVIGHFRGQFSPVGDEVSRDKVFLNDLGKRHPSATLTDGTRMVMQLRAKKSDAEIGLIRTAIDITTRAHDEAMRMVAPGWNEFEVQALVEYTFRRNGGDRPSFASIVGSADNATTLHYNRNDRPMQAGELVVMDIGASYGGYSADVTRTLPLSGTFTAAQRAIYELVRRAQIAGESATRVGAPQRGSGVAAAEKLSRGLTELGLMESPDATYDCDASGQRQCPQLRLFYMHGLGHGIGLEVHDPDISDGKAWEVGSVMTIEPGIYVRRNLAEVLADTPRNRDILKRMAPALAKYAGIGVRIEDDYLLSATGLEWLSKLPREAGEVEELLRAPRATAPRARDAALVDRYRRSLQ
jgi:Xaa-Pro aminopeptidase